MILVHIPTKKLSKIICQDPNFRESKWTYADKTKTSIVEGIDDCINTWCTTKGISRMYLLEWKTTVIKEIGNKITELKNKPACHKASTTWLEKSPD